jgi:hypothetical protein
VAPPPPPASSSSSSQSNRHKLKFGSPEIALSSIFVLTLQRRSPAIRNEVLMCNNPINTMRALLAVHFTDNLCPSCAT